MTRHLDCRQCLMMPPSRRASRHGACCPCWPHTDGLTVNRILIVKQENQLRVVTTPRGVLLLFTSRRGTSSGDRYRLRAVDIPAVSLSRPIPAGRSEPKARTRPYSLLDGRRLALVRLTSTPVCSIALGRGFGRRRQAKNDGISAETGGQCPVGGCLTPTPGVEYCAATDKAAANSGWLLSEASAVATNGPAAVTKLLVLGARPQYHRPDGAGHEIFNRFRNLDGFIR